MSRLRRGGAPRILSDNEGKLIGAEARVGAELADMDLDTTLAVLKDSLAYSKGHGLWAADLSVETGQVVELPLAVDGSQPTLLSAITG